MVSVSPLSALGIPTRCGRPRRRQAFPGSVASDANETETLSFHGAYLQLDATARLGFTWKWTSLPFPGIESPGATAVTIQLEPQDQSTALTLIQIGFNTGVSRAAHEKVVSTEFVLSSKSRNQDLIGINAPSCPFRLPTHCYRCPT